MRCPRCGRSFYPADWYYNRKRGIWKCDKCGAVIRECPFCKSAAIFVDCTKYEDIFYCNTCNKNFVVPKKGGEE